MTLNGYKHRSKIPIGSVSGGETDILMELTVHKGAGTNSAGHLYLHNKIGNWPDDIAITQSDGNTLVPFVRLYYDTSEQLILIKLPTIPSSGTLAYYLYSNYSAADDLDEGVGCNVADFADPLSDRKEFVTDHYHTNGSDYPHQGVCPDGAGNYFLSTSTPSGIITKWNSGGTKTLEVKVESTYHLGAMCYYNNKVWAVVSSYPTNGETIRVRSYDPSDLSQNTGDAQNISNTGYGDAGSLDFYDGYWWVLTYYSGKTYLQKFNTSWSLQDRWEISSYNDLPSQSSHGLENGLAWKDDKLYIAPHDSSTGGYFIYVFELDPNDDLRYIDKHPIASEGQGIQWDGDTLLSIDRPTDRTYFTTLEDDATTNTFGGGWDETGDGTDVWSISSNVAIGVTDGDFHGLGREEVFFDDLGHDYVLYKTNIKVANTANGGGLNIHHSNKYVMVVIKQGILQWRDSRGYTDSGLSYSAGVWYEFSILYRKSDGKFNMCFNGTWSGWQTGATTSHEFVALVIANDTGTQNVYFRYFYAGKSLETMPTWETPTGPNTVSRGTPLFW